MGDPVRRSWARSGWSLAAIAALLVGLVAWWGWAPRAGADTELGTTGKQGTTFSSMNSASRGRSASSIPRPCRSRLRSSRRTLSVSIAIPSL